MNSTRALISMKPKWKIVLALSVILVALVFLRPSPECEVRYTITDLGTFVPSSGHASIAYAINNQGHVAGYSNTVTGSPHAFLWTPEEGMKDLGSFFPARMNDRDEVVGSPFGQPIRPCLWAPVEGLITLGPLGKADSISLGINNRGEVAGSTVSISRTSSGFIWTATEGITRLKQEWLAYDIDDSGEVLCTTGTNKNEPFLYNRTTGRVSPSRGLQGSVRYPHGDPAKLTTTEGGQIHSLVPFTSLEEFPIAAEEGYLIYVNDSDGVKTVGTIWYTNPHFEKVMSMAGSGGSVVHRYLHSALMRIAVANWPISNFKAVLWEAGETVDLGKHIPPESAWDALLGAQAINKSGQIAGTGSIDGDYHGFLLTPIAAPERGSQ